MKRYFITIAGVVAAAVSFSQVWAEVLDSQIEYSYAEVVLVKPAKNELVVKEYDWDTDMEAEVTYKVAPGTELIGFDTLSSLKPGDELNIEYTAQSGKRTARYINLYQDEETADEYMPEVPQIDVGIDY